MRNNITFNTQTSIGQNIFSRQQSLSLQEKTTRKTPSKRVLKIKIRYCLHQLKLCFLLPYVAFAIYISFTITISVLVLCLISYEKRVDTCEVIYKVLITDVDNQDSTPQYVVIGDVNNDTRLDLVVVTTGINSIKIFLSNKNNTFVNHLTLFTGPASQPYSAALGHLNHDQCLDIAVANYASHSVIIFFGDCQGYFRNHSTYSTDSSQPIMIKIGDLNNDQLLDLVITNNGTDSIGVLLSRNDGTFTDPVTYSTAFDSFPHDVIISDINNDGQSDLIVANYGTDNVGIHLGYGNGNFLPQMTLSTGSRSRPYSLALADLNQDHKLDIIVGNIGTGTITLFLGNGDGTFIEKTFLTNILGPIQLQIGDLNNDYYKDLAIVSAWNNSVFIILGYDNEIFGTQFAYSTNLNSQPWSLALADINDDNMIDVVVANTGTNNIGVLFGYDPGVFRYQTTFSTSDMSFAKFVTLADVNNDKILDIITVHHITTSLGIFLGYGNATFVIEKTYSTGSDSIPYGVSVGDFNEDERLDIVVVNFNTSNIGLFLGYGNGSFQNQKTFSTGRDSQPTSIAVGDFNIDNHLDVIVTNFLTNNIGLFLGDSNGSFVRQDILSTNELSCPTSIVVADFNNDQRLDIAVISFDSNNVEIFLGYGNGNFTEKRTYSSNPFFPTFITTGDINNDNRTDIIIITAFDTEKMVNMFLGVGDGTFETIMRISNFAGFFPYELAIGDVNNDGNEDIVVTNTHDNKIGILLGHGNGTFASERMYSAEEHSSSQLVALGDLNSDNRLDIVTVDFSAFEINIFLGYSHGILANPTTYPTGSSVKPQAVVLGDFNADKQIDIAVANYGINTIDVYIKSIDSTLMNKMSYQTGADTLPKSLITTDYNKDLKIDIAVINSGGDNIGLYQGFDNGTFKMETFISTGVDSQPCAIAAGDLNNDTYTDLVVSNFGTSNIAVFLGYQYPNHRIGGIYFTGIYSHPHHIATGDLNNDNHTDVVIIDSNIGNIVVFLGLGNGSFSTQAVYPSDYTFKPIRTVIADFNNDSQFDVVVCLELSIIAVYLGYGNGTLASSKIISIGDQLQPNGVYVADFNHDKCMDLVIVANSKNDHVIVLLGSCNGAFVNQTNYSVGLNSGRLSVSVGDLNLDDNLDIVVTNFHYNNIGIFFGYGNGTFADQVTYSTGKNANPIALFINDLNGDNYSDIVVVNSRNNSIGTFLGLGNGSFADQKTCSLSSNYELIYDADAAFGDFNNDNLLDVAISLARGEALLLLGHRDYIFQIARVYSIGHPVYFGPIVAMDFNNDRVLDMVVIDLFSKNMVVLIGSCCEMFLYPTTFSTGVNSGPHSIALNDFNMDSILDVAIANLLAENIGILLGHGNGTFHAQIVYSTGLGSCPYALVVSDCNHDGYVDIFVANYGSETIGVLIGYGNGTFGSYITHSIGVGSRANGITVLDFDNNGQLDIAITNDGTNTIAVLFGYGNGSFGGLITYKTGYHSQPCAIASGDYNNDNITDIIITECGSNNIGVIAKFC